ncbi:fused MFS/spermidine synthase [Arthrobacter sp. H5]|uniref:spermidine synthase n=1 Tax=Arthrobacter sp. H5 TaxID=1267973 RepID=UPI0004883722|nr:fused MFS/spermidine synthase [Arthrobacter sp. H5]
MYSSQFLSHIGSHAEIDGDAFNDGAFILSIGGAQQSHVDLANPGNVFYEYLRRIANVLDVFKPADQPIRVLHLGAGALTLARYVQATRPGSEQAAVELERELLDFVVEHLPLPVGTNCTILIEDARAAAARFPPGSFDAVVLDVFAGADAPGHLADAGFYRELTELTAPGGVILINVGDDPPLAFARRQMRLLHQTGYDAAALADAAMFSRRHPGNIVLAAVRDQWPPAWTEALLAAGPHPAAVLTGVDLEEFAAN